MTDDDIAAIFWREETRNKSDPFCWNGDTMLCYQVMCSMFVNGYRTAQAHAAPKVAALEALAALAAKANKTKSYHDVEVEFGGVRRHIFDMDFHYMLTCTRVGGWKLWHGGSVVAGEYHFAPLNIYAAGVLVCGKEKKA